MRCMGRECKEDKHAGDGTLVAHKLLGFCGDGDGQSGLGAYVRALTTHHWAINSNGLHLSAFEYMYCEIKKTLCWRAAMFASDGNMAQMAKVFKAVFIGD